YFDGGGEENLSINGSPIQVVNSFAELPAALGGVDIEVLTNLPGAPANVGVVSLTGAIETLIVGGQELAIDQLCAIGEELADPCALTDPSYQYFSCEENGQFDILLDFTVTDPGAAQFTVEGPFGVETFSYADLPVAVGPFFGDAQSTYTITVFDLELADCGFNLDIEAPNCSDFCLDFELLEEGDAFGSNTPAGNAPGDLFYFQNGINAYLAEFSDANTNPTFGTLTILDGSGLGASPIGGLAASLNNVSIDFTFTDLPNPVYQAQIGYLYQGGSINLQVNMGDLWVASSIADLPAEPAPGVSLSVVGSADTGYLVLTGDLESILIGGQELIVDNLCTWTEGYDPSCLITTVLVQDLPCGVNDEYYIELDLAIQQPGAFGFEVAIDGVSFGTFDYENLPITLGPLQGGSNQVYELSVQDVEFPDCDKVVQFATQNCSDQCLQFEDLDPNTEFGPNNGNAPGDVVYDEDGVVVSLGEFEDDNGNILFSLASVESTSNFPAPNFTDQFFFVSLMSLEFDFTGLPEDIYSVSFLYNDWGGPENLSINGGTNYVVNTLPELETLNIPGFTIEVDPLNPPG
ncbi:MAG: hypothetical protein AAFU60_09835, partial [Bacteroidota bacterium]